MPQRSIVPVLALLALSLAACAGTPAPPQEAPAPAPVSESLPPPAAPAPPPVPAGPPVSKQICGVEVGRMVDLAELGVPEGSRPLDLALTADMVWLLFEPPLLVGLPRQATEHTPVAIPELGAVEEMADLIPGPADAAWSALAVDWDGSVWGVSRATSDLWHKRPGHRPEAVRLSGAPALRQGGFRDILVGRGSLWVVPVCASSAVWRLAPSGKLLGQSFEEVSGSCPAALFERDWSGTFWALRPDAGELFQMGSDLGWQPAGAGMAPPAPAPPGSEPVESWFFWGAEPMGLSGDGSLLYRNAGGKVEAFREDCGEGNALVGVAGDRQGWAVLTRQWLRLADHQ